MKEPQSPKVKLSFLWNAFFALLPVHSPNDSSSALNDGRQRLDKRDDDNLLH